jgi:hypothetical protein
LDLDRGQARLRRGAGDAARGIAPGPGANLTDRRSARACSRVWNDQAGRALGNRKKYSVETTRRCPPAGGLFVSCVVARRTPSRLEAEMIEGARP